MGTKNRSQLWGVVVLALLLLQGAGVRAEDARRLLDQGKFLTSRARFNDSIAVLARARAATQDAKLLGRILLHMGINHAILGNPTKARAAFGEALKSDPEVALDPTQIKAAIVELFHAVRQDLGAMLSITADLPGARVKVNGKDQGPAPVRLRLTVGAHLVQVSGPAGETYRQRVVIRPGAARTVNAVLASPAPPARSRLWTWVAAGGTAAALGVGIGFAVAAKSKHDEWEQTGPGELADDLEAKGRLRQTTANVMFGVAGALAVTSVVLYFLEGRPSGEARRARVMLGPARSGAALLFSTQF